MRKMESVPVASPNKYFSSKISHQLSLFSWDVGENYSNIVELYNEIPKYVHNVSMEESHLESKERSFKVGGKLYKVILHPARIKIQDPETGKLAGTKEMFIGTREEFVEDAITKIAIENKCLFELKDTTRVFVTIRQIQEELKRIKRSYSYEEIKEAIQVLGGARIILEDENGDAVAGTSTYPEFQLSTESKDGRGYVQLHPLVSEYIKVGLYRQIDYELCMRFKSRYARRIFKFLNLRFSGVRYGQPPIDIYLRAFIGRHGFTLYSRLSDNAKQFKVGLRELVNAEVLESWAVERKKGLNADYVFKLIVHSKFSLSMMRANGIKKGVQKKLGKAGNG